MAKISPALRSWRGLGRWRAGRWLFTRVVCGKAPYFSTISPSIAKLDIGVCEASITRHRRITNHIGSIHAIAMCNLAELVGGLMTDASVPAGMRWIPRGMQVKYLKKAMGKLTATAVPAQPFRESESGYEELAMVGLVDESGDKVFEAAIAMWITPKPKSQTA